MIWRLRTPLDIGWPGAVTVFKVAEILFGLCFTVEVLIKILAFRQFFFRSGFNIFDMVVVAVWCMDFAAGLRLIANPMLLRLIRLIRLLRLLRLVKVMEMFDTLMLMVTSIRASASVLCWGTLVLTLTMTGCALVVNDMVWPVMDDNSVDLEVRKQLFAFWGTYGRCMVTMFEVTLGNWVPACRLLMNNVSEWYGLAFILYKSIVGFGIVKVITGVFMHETFKCASIDDDLMIQHRVRAKKHFRTKMSLFFRESDASGDGMLDVEEFKAILEDERVNNWLQALEINIHRPDEFFRGIAGSDMLLSSDELVKNMALNRGAASQICANALLDETAEVKKSFGQLASGLQAFQADIRAIQSSSISSHRDVGLAISKLGQQMNALSWDNKVRGSYSV